LDKSAICRLVLASRVQIITALRHRKGL
jgi:hypothetical protein